MLTLVLVFVICLQIGLTLGFALLAGVLYSFSPEVVRYSSFIGVDVPLMFFCFLTTSIALAADKRFNKKLLWTLGVVSGLAVSCKYNGLPDCARTAAFGFTIGRTPQRQKLFDCNRRTNDRLFSWVTLYIALLLALLPTTLVRSLALCYRRARRTQR